MDITGKAGVRTDPRLGLREKLGYGAGDLASNLSWNLVGGFLLYYYTDVAAISAGVLGTMFLIARLLDAIVDPFIGILVDRTRTRWGKARPYLVFVSVPFGILGVLTFTVPDVGDTGKIIYAFLTYLTLGLLFSLVNVPYSSLLPMMTRDSHERMQMGGLRAVGSSIGTIIVTATTTPFVALLGGGDAQFGWTVAALIYSALSVGFFAFTFAACKERYALPAESESMSPRAAVRTLLGNRPWKVTFAYGVLNFVRLGTVLAVTVYFALEVLHKPWAISVLLPMVSGMMLLAGLVAAPYYRRFGKRRGNLQALLVGGLAWSSMIFFEASFPLFLAFYTVATLAIGLSMTSMFTMTADCVEYQQWRYGTRNEGLLSSGISFATKVGSALGSAGVAYGLGLAGYAPDHVGDSALTAIRVLFYGAPVLLIALQAWAIAYWDLDGEHERMAAEIDRREND
ncbi:MFS transporter [Saccharopolyspora flava]|uniref:Glycoside/pentoside/hexuronide:cation symporter, GPH family n=1 Tax=Saccharopolyspora flava TaxID=95161 RepID=A0A1I6V2R5_9PSEU|nr:MFS transporter [Saccharopolyspora flava]SFT07906.1 glycoside/pentoside/hexuronide:cation symporter, GPH family [Saccharopolyspora flava]